MKYLGVNLTKEMKNLFTDNYKTLMREDTNKWKIFHTHGIEGLILLKCP